MHCNRLNDIIMYKVVRGIVCHFRKYAYSFAYRRLNEQIDTALMSVW